MSKIVNANVFEPTNALFKEHRSDKSTCTIVTCSNSDNCDLYKKGQCTMIGMFNSKCPYGTVSRVVGPTKRARKYYTWITEQKKKHEGVLGKLGSSSHVMAKVGEYVVLPYSHMGIEKDIPFIGRGGMLGGQGGFMKLTDFTVDMIYKLANLHPEALFGGEITTYQKEEVPKFMKHLSEIMPDLFNEFLVKYPQYESFRSITNVGRKALLSTLAKNVGEFKDIHKGTWTWDGTYLTSKNSHAAFMLTRSFSEIRVKPSGDIEVVITDDKQVLPETKFLD